MPRHKEAKSVAGRHLLGRTTLALLLGASPLVLRSAAAQEWSFRMPQGICELLMQVPLDRDLLSEVVMRPDFSQILTYADENCSGVAPLLIGATGSIPFPAASTGDGGTRGQRNGDDTAGGGTGGDGTGSGTSGGTGGGGTGGGIGGGTGGSGTGGGGTSGGTGGGGTGGGIDGGTGGSGTGGGGTSGGTGGGGGDSSTGQGDDHSDDSNGDQSDDNNGDRSDENGGWSD